MRHTEALTRILGMYAPGYPMLQALEAYIQTVISTAVNEARADIGKSVCEGLHPGPSAGVKCASCLEALSNINQLMAVEAEIERSKERG